MWLNHEASRTILEAEQPQDQERQGKDDQRKEQELRHGGRERDGRRIPDRRDHAQHQDAELTAHRCSEDSAHHVRDLTGIDQPTRWPTQQTLHNETDEHVKHRLA
ncbi:hypothetical protein [Micromonospora tulbaghiae]|uniref:hypothetical protein n=1 Tax=Micromonospora tulbaghiae TaxID=479978 RepID=UPI0013C52734|nr:hypothetical protein [Micromonospora tulbaghiae]